MYYAYAYLREKDNTPYYIGKGKDTRAWDKSHNVKIPTEEHRMKISLAMEGKSKEIVTCPHCNKSGGKLVMSRHHFNNCKHRE